MIREAIDRIAELTAAAAQPVVYELDAVQKLLVFPDGRQVIVEKGPPELVRMASTFQAFVDMVKRFDGDRTVFVGDECVTAVIDDDLSSSRRGLERVVLRLNESRFAAALPDGKAMTQRQLLQWLRRNCESDAADGLAAVIRQVHWSRRSDGSSTIERGKESLGRSIEAKIQGTVDIPEEIQFHERLIDVAGFNAICGMWLMVDVEPEEQSFSVMLAPGELSRATAEWKSEMVALLRADIGIERVYAGEVGSVAK